MIAVYPKHFVGQALRWAYLCGEDQYNGKSYEHRRQWIVDKVNELSDAFAINIYASSTSKEKKGYTVLMTLGNALDVHWNLREHLNNLAHD